MGLDIPIPVILPLRTTDVGEVADVLIEAGAHKGKGTNRICIPESMICDALSKCPSEFYTWSVDGKKTLIGGDSRQYSTCLVDPGMNTDNCLLYTSDAADE